ncbi:hypothetical protein [Tuwongella immobilis]|uniref:Neutral/alkaline non-lysosomal ceramidase N-terminal domain-containing protein n=1 Tax=Tuwongella immobilis TaxID=692036 RepID=A0A6C2YKP1_9BACT|nr:hypothetical protein [Tuwongella immobilis]VIP01675.1 Uncharacterized protein OS=Chthoniobacter flavus Ellin428 GN=CfE428DRAFT_5616 PE=4 SV=1: Ceramidase_alk [Tuwongella immobilis]VTR99113.1 Uncharacterized protein OS=Chthoniobacter flavus Ellin428 GN=CfE428DRAFT_5616 PE=4 SV=1: Ceramidase_alk [Tuwongella immobilis]
MSTSETDVANGSWASSCDRRRWLTTTAAGVSAGVSAGWLAAPGSARAAAKEFALVPFSAEITPPMGHALMGGGIAPAKSVADPLFASGIVLRGIDSKPVVIAALDWCEIRNDAYDRWREALAKAAGTTRERVMLMSLHQHDTPIADLAAEKFLLDAKAKGSICMLDFHERVVERVAKAVGQAVADAKAWQPIDSVGFGKGKVVGVASNRRYRDANGVWRHDRTSATRNPEVRATEEGTVDPDVKTLSFWHQNRAIVAISGYATHPMSFYGKGEVTADFVGMARRMRQSATPQTLQLYCSGCSGNVTAGKYNDGAAMNRPILADRLAAGMKLAWESTERFPLESLQFRSVPLTLSPRSGGEFRESELRARIQHDSRPFGQCLAALGLSWLKRCQAGQPIDVPLLDCGSAAFLLLPAESYVEFQLFAQSVRRDGRLLVAGYGECGPGYIPIERAWQERDGNLTDWCWVDPGSQAKMEAAIRKVLAG